MSSKHYILTPGDVELATLKAIYRGGVTLALDEKARDGIQQARATVKAIVDKGKATYGINAGCGKLSQTPIPVERLAEMQRNLVLSHCVGLGQLLGDDVVRLVIATKVISLSRGHSGIRIEIIDALIALFNAGVMPCIPEKGSVGASGDLAPLSHLSLALLGEGEVRVKGELISAREGLARAGLRPFVLGPKEGTALINGTQVSTALALSGLFEAENVFAAGLIAGALSLEAIKGSVQPYDSRVHKARGHKGQIEVAAAVMSLLDSSDIVRSHTVCNRIQDPYSIRCVPQVMGACLDSLNYAANVLRIEANAASDNPLIFGDDVISGGNFHAEPVAFAADIIALAVAEIGAISERRTALLLDSGLSGLPPFLVEDSGVNSGFMTAQVTSAALASENKSLAHPSSVDSLPTSANQEDHVSMATYGARRLGAMCFNTAGVVGIEAMAAVQGMEFHRPLSTSPLLEEVLVAIRERVSFLRCDRVMSGDIERMQRWASDDCWPDCIASLLPTQAD